MLKIPSPVFEKIKILLSCGDDGEVNAQISNLMLLQNPQHLQYGEPDRSVML